jgi:tetratricopeptide (TPR) repeat protein
VTMPSSTADASPHNGADPRGRAARTYLAALRDDAVLARLVETYVATTVASPLGPTDALQTVLGAARLALVGAPGTGKTSVLRMGLARLAREAGLAAESSSVPVYVDLTDARPGEGIDDLIARAVSPGGDDAARVALPPSAVFIDNLDRATDVYLLEGLELLLRAGGRAGPAVVMACREADWSGYRTWFADVPTAELQPLSPLAVSEALGRALPPATAAAAETWLARDRVLAAAVRLPLALSAFIGAVRDRPADLWRRAHVLDALLEASLARIPTTERPAYRAALADVALDSLGQGRLVEVDTLAMGLGVTRDDMIRTGVVVPRGAKLEFVQPLLAQHCAASRLADRAAADPERLPERLGDLSDPRRADTLVHVYHLATDPVAFVLALLPLPTGPELAARCLTEPDAADPAGPTGGVAVVDALCGRAPDLAAPTLYRLGEGLHRAGHDAAAEVALRAALERAGDGSDLAAVFLRVDVDAPMPVDAWVRRFLAARNRGLALRGMRDVAAAATALVDAGGALDRLGADLSCERGVTAAAEGDLPRALAAFEAAVAAEPDCARYLYHYGRSLLEVGRVDEAVRHLQRARDIAPGQPEVEAALGQAYRALGWLEEALGSFQAAALAAPADARCSHWAGEVHAELGDLEAAVASMQHAVAARPNEAAWHDALGQVLAELGRYGAAARAFRNAHALDPDRALYVRHLGRAHLGAGEATAAVEALRQAVALAPDDAGALGDLGRALAATGEGAVALEILRRAVTMDGGWPEDHLHLARLLRGQGRLDEALSHAARAAELAPSSALALAELGRVHDARGEYRQALGAYNRAVAQAPDDPEARQLVAAVKRALGDGDGAARDWRAAAALEPKSPSALEQLARLYEDRGDREAALDVLVQAADLVPDSVDYRRRAGRLSLDLGSPRPR